MPTQQPPTPLPHVFQLFLLVAASLTALSYGFNAFCRLVLHYTYPYIFPMPPRVTAFGDYYGFANQIHFLRLGTFFSGHDHGYPFNYPAPLIWPFLFFDRIGGGNHRLIYLLLFMAIVLFLAIFGFARLLIRRGIKPLHAYAASTASALLSYPIFFVINRANMEFFCWIVLGIAIWAYITQRWWIFAIFIGAAMSMKMVPFIFFGLFLKPRRFKEAFVATLAFLAINLASLRFIGPTIALANRGINYGIDFFMHDYVFRWRSDEIRCEHSLYTLFRILMRNHQEWYPVGWRIFGVTMGLTCLVLFFVYVQKLPRINQVLFLTVAATILPPAAFDYTLLHLYFPWLLLILFAIQAEKEHRTIAGLATVFVTFAILFTPQGYLIYHGILFAGTIKTFVLLYLAYLSLRYPFRESEPVLALANNPNPTMTRTLLTGQPAVAH